MQAIQAYQGRLTDESPLHLRGVQVKAFMLATLLLPGCAAIQPQSVNLVLDHTSHISQHFGADSKDYGQNVLALDARWAVDRLAVEVSEGICLEHERITTTGESICGSLYGPKEIFNARISYSLWQKHDR